MSYQVLARKWRPRNFQEVVGQQHVLTALSNGLTQNKVHHAYLFSGTRGVGKTTIARILAKSLNCEQGVTSTPCGECVHCQAIDQGRFVDLLEIDAASRTKVDDTRELLDNVQYKPAQGRYKVYLIDEVHMLSKHSFNALLKTLEEPPEYVKFLLATTDPQKLPITVLSRCLQFHLKTILPENIEKQLVHILQHEQATFDIAALSVIAKAANGSMRDALSLTDQALAFGFGNIEYQAVLKMLGTIDNSHLYYLLHFIASGNVEKVFQKIEEFVHLGADFAKLHQELAALCHQVALIQIQKKVSGAQASPVQLLSERLTPEEVQLYYQIAVQGYKDYTFSPNGKIAFEMTVMRLLAFKPANYIDLDESLLTEQKIEIDGEPSGTTASAETTSHFNAPNEETVGISPAKTTIDATHQEVVKEAVKVPTENFQLAPIIENQESTPQNEATEPSIELVTSEDRTESITHSRNMLRSHRLKREEEKKSLATTANLNSEAVVAKETNHSEDLTTEQPAVKKVNKVVECVEQETIAKDIISCDEHESSFDSLPPIESYLEDNFNASEMETSVEPFEEYSECQYSQEGDSKISSIEDDTNKHIDTVNLTDKPDYFSDEQLDVPAIDIAKYVEDKISDPWSLLIQNLQLVGLVKLLAKNCVMKQAEKNIILTLKAKQQHLLNNSEICDQLQEKLKSHFGEQTSMYIEVGEVDGQFTPIETELNIFQQYLNNAKEKIKEDHNIQMWADNYGAKIYENSIIPL